MSHQIKTVWVEGYAQNWNVEEDDWVGGRPEFVEYVYTTNDEMFSRNEERLMPGSRREAHFGYILCSGIVLLDNGWIRAYWANEDASTFIPPHQILAAE